MIPFAPQPMPAQQRRYLDALVHIYDWTSASVVDALPAANVFDFADGLRLIVTRERMLSGTVVLHLSACLDPNGVLAMSILRASDRAQQYIGHVEQRWEDLSQSRAAITFAGILPNGLGGQPTPHWYGEAPQ